MIAFTIDVYCDSTTANSNIITFMIRNTTSVLLYYYSKKSEHISRFYKTTLYFNMSFNRQYTHK